MTTVNYQLNQRAYYNGQEVTLKSYDKLSGKCTIVIDGELKVVDWNDIFGINNKKEELSKDYSTKLAKATERLNYLKEQASLWGNIFDFNLGGVRQNRGERISFVREYGNDLNNMNAEQQEQYKALLNQGSEYSGNKNYALGMQLSYTHQVVSAANAKRDILNQISIFNG